MWVTQSYLGNPDNDPKVYAYYLFEEYSPVQEEFTRHVEARLAHIGDQFGKHATILMPNRYNTPRIEKELRDSLGSFWRELDGRLPGLLVTTTKLSDFNYQDGDAHFFSLSGCNYDQAFDVLTSVHRLMQQCVEHAHSKDQDASTETRIQRFIEAIDAKPGIWGFSFDLKKYFRR